MEMPQQSTSHKPRSSISAMLRKIPPSVFSWMQGGGNPHPTSENNGRPSSTHMATPITFSSPNSLSNLSLNSHMPLLSHNIGNNAGSTQNGEMIPDTVNELAAEAKARAVKKARKISRVFGEMPAITALLEDAGGSGGGDGAVGISLQPDRRRRASMGFFQMPSLPDLGVPRVTRPATTGSPRATRSPNNLPKVVCRPATGKVTLELDMYVEELEEHPPVLTPRQTRRVSMAKLTRHLGENIPPELLSPSPSNEPRLSFSNTIQGSQTDRARKSLDAALLNKHNHDRHDNPLSANIKRSASLWTRKKGTNEAILAADGSFQERYNESFGNEEEVRERCKALRVKRVRKVRQILGQEPPPEFIRAIASDPERILNLGEGYRDSVATIISTTSFRSTSPLSRSQSGSVASTTSEAGFVTAPEGEGRLSVPELGRSPTPPLPKLPSLEDVAPARRQRESISPAQSYATPPFRERRLRIAKLIRFFGVDYQNISNSIRPNREETRNERSHDPPTVEVDIQIAVPGRFWGLFERHNDREANVDDVIGRLRDLRVG